MTVGGVQPVGASSTRSSLLTLLKKSIAQTQSSSTAASDSLLLGSTSRSETPGSLYNSLGKLLGSDKVQAVAKKAERSSPAAIRLLESLKAAAASIDAGDTKGGRKQAQQLLRKQPNNATALHLVGQSYLVEKDYKLAERAYAKVAALAPNNARVKRDLADARTLQKSDDQVLKHARSKLISPAHRTDGLRLLLHLTDRSPDNVDAYLALADGFTDARQPLQVMGALQKALDKADEDQIDEVIVRAKKLSEKQSGVGLTHNILGSALQKAGRYREAMSELKRAVEIAPNNLAYTSDLAGAHVAQARAKLDSGDVAGARADLEIAQSLDASNAGLGEVSARVAAERAEGFITAGLYNRALSELHTASSKAPDDAQFKASVASKYLRVAAHYDDLDADSIALTSYQKAYELDPTSEVARRHIGELSYQAGLDAIGRLDYDGAITHLDRAYQTSRGTASYRQELARAYDLRGQRYQILDELSKAIADFKTGVGLDPTNTSLDANLSAALAADGGT